MRESPAIPIINNLLAHQVVVKAYDPVATHEAEKIFKPELVELCSSLAQVLEDAQAVILVTRWDEFQTVPALLSKMEPQPVFIDGRRMLNKHDFANYEGIGL
jgi:UDPglucose 6-dehydrogenase/GDP-mannose 6-dehydrogenase